MVEPVGLAALVLDAAFGWPDRLYRRVGHPVGAFARMIEWCAQRWNRASSSRSQRRLGGALTLALVAGFAALIGCAAGAAARHLPDPYGWFVIALCAFPAIAQRSLFDHVRPVLAALSAGDLLRARQSVARIVGRDTAQLDEAGVSRAAIESLAESFCDGLIAPLFWLLVAGLPGVWAFKAISTADSLIGHKEQPWRDFGLVAARIDDIANWIPARIAGVLICLAGRGGWRTMLRDHAKHASPNAGWPEAAMAGALGVWLAGPVAYDGAAYAKPFIGAGRDTGRDTGKDAGMADLRRAIGICARACALAWIVVGGWAWLA